MTVKGAVDPGPVIPSVVASQITASAARLEVRRDRLLELTLAAYPETKGTVANRWSASLHAAELRITNAIAASDKPIAVVDLGDRGSVEHYADRIDWVRELPKGEYRSPVFDGELRVLERIRVDGQEFYRVQQGQERLVQALQLFDQLRRDGQILDRSRGADALAAILRFETKGKVRSGHAAIGVYAEEDGRLTLCLDPVPLSDEQQEVLESTKAARAVVPRTDELQVYIDLCGRFEVDEWVPSAGQGAMGAFAQLLREQGMLFPHVYNHSIANGVGKTVVSTTFTESLYGRRGVMADAIGSEYRFALLVDAGLPLSVSEAERMDQHRFGGALKDAAERALFSKRGTKDLGHRNYLSRSALNLTGNSFPFSARPVRVRFLAPRFDESRAQLRHRPEERQKLDSLLGRLKPIGFGLATFILGRYPTRDLLIAEVARVREELEAAAPGYDWRDARRSQAWAIVLIGTRMWGAYATSLGATWPFDGLLQAEAFVRRVVDTVDRATFESESRPVDRFRNWLGIWRSTNIASTRQITFEGGAGERERTTYVSEAKGEGVEFEDGVLTVGEARISGTYVGQGMLDLYNQNQAPEHRIEGLNELARQAADSARIPRDAVLDLAGDARSHSFSRGRKRRAAFVPESPES